MKKKKIIISCVVGVLVLAVAFGAYSYTNTDGSYDFEAITIDTSTVTNGESSDNDSKTITIEENENPLAVIGGGSSSGSTRALNSSEESQIASILTNKLNQERAKDVSTNSTLLSTSSVRAQECESKFSHTRPNGSQWETVFTNPNASGLHAGENLANITGSAKSSYSSSYINQLASTMHQTLMNSASHKSVILDSSYTQVGVSVSSKVSNGKVYVYAVEHFKNNVDVNTKAVSSSNTSSTKVTVKKPSLSLKAKSKSFTATAKSSGANGYQIQYSTKKNMSGKKTVTTSKSSNAIKKLSKKKKYYVRVRAYKKVNGKTYYSSYSAIKSVKTK